MVAAAERQGTDVAFDVIPHDWNHTLIKSILPPWAMEGGTPRIIERLQDPATRERMKANPKHMWLLVTDERWDDIALLNSEENPDLVGGDVRGHRADAKHHALRRGARPDARGRRDDRRTDVDLARFRRRRHRAVPEAAAVRRDIRHAGPRTLRRAGQVRRGPSPATAGRRVSSRCTCANAACSPSGRASAA